MFAPWWVPHVTERVGRSISYWIYLLLNAAFNLGAGFAHTIPAFLVCRFFAGFFGGPTIVLLEGSFADVWTADRTNTYYAIQGLASFWGAGFGRTFSKDNWLPKLQLIRSTGPLIGGYLVKATNDWRWTQYFPAALAGAVLVLGIGMPETYQREIPRRQGPATGRTRAEIVATQAPAQSGTTIGAMINCTVIQPVVQFFSEPVVTLCAVIMFITWLLTFQWFISVPAALGPPPPMGPGFSITRIGLAFLTAVVGSAMGALTVIIIETLANARAKRNGQVASVEARVIPAMLGVVFITVSLFWIGKYSRGRLGQSANAADPNL